MNPRFVGSEASRRFQFLNGSCVLANFKKDSAEDVMSERQAGMQLDGLLREHQSRFGLFVSHMNICDLKPGQSVVRRVFDLFFESRDGPLVVALVEQIASHGVLHAGRVREIRGQALIFLPGVALILLRRQMLGETRTPDHLAVPITGRYLRRERRQSQDGQPMRDDQIFTVYVLIAKPAEEGLRRLEIAFEQQQQPLVIAHRHVEVRIVFNAYLTSLPNAPEGVVVIAYSELAQ